MADMSTILVNGSQMFTVPDDRMGPIIDLLSVSAVQPTTASPALPPVERGSLAYYQRALAQARRDKDIASAAALEEKIKTLTAQQRHANATARQMADEGAAIRQHRQAAATAPAEEPEAVAAEERQGQERDLDKILGDISDSGPVPPSDLEDGN